MVQNLPLYAGIAVPVPRTYGVVVIGTPIGHLDWLQLKLRELISAQPVALRALPGLGSVQASQHLIVSSHSALAVHLLRTLPVKVRQGFALAHDGQKWVAFGHGMGHLSGAATWAALQPIA